MATDPTGTVAADPTGTTAAAADGSGGGAGGSGGESIEALRERLNTETAARAELERKNAQLLSEKTNNAAALAAAEARLAAQGGPSAPPTGQPTDPFAEQIAVQQKLLDHYGASSYEGLQAKSTILSLQGSQATWIRQERAENLNLELLAIPDAKRPAVIAKLRSGEFNSVKSALDAVERSNDSEAVTRLQAEIDALKAQLANGGAPNPNVSLGARGSAPQVTTRGLAASEWTRILNAGGPEATKLENEYDAGKVALDFTR